MSEDSIFFESYCHAAAYNYLIGNRDWSIVASRNAKLFYKPDHGKYMVVPYDFDYSNIVGASYRREVLSKDMTHPFDRVYSGEYFQNRSAEILKTFYHFQQPIMEAILTANNPIDADRRKRITKYFNSWFEMVGKSKPEDLIYGSVCRYRNEL